MRDFLRSREFRIPFAAGAVIAIAAGIHSYGRGGEMVVAICDGFFIAGFMLAAFGGLTFVRNQGMFDAINYSVSHMFAIRWPGLSRMEDDRRREKYIDYKERVQKNRKSPKGLFLAGGVYLVLAALMLVVYTLTI